MFHADGRTDVQMDMSKSKIGFRSSTNHRSQITFIGWERFVSQNGSYTCRPKSRDIGFEPTTPVFAESATFVRYTISEILWVHYEAIYLDFSQPVCMYLSTRGVHVLRSPNLLFIKKITHHRKLKMQSFLNVITL